MGINLYISKVVTHLSNFIIYLFMIFVIVSRQKIVKKHGKARKEVENQSFIEMPSII